MGLRGLRLVAALCLGTSVVAFGQDSAARRPRQEREGDPGGGATSVVKGTIVQKDRIGDGWWMNTSATLRTNGTLTGMTELKNHNSGFGFSGEVVIVLIDHHLQPLKYFVPGTWGINACLFRCPKTRTVTWEASVPPDEWRYIGPSVRGMAILHRPEPSENFWKWIEGHLSQVLDTVAKVAKLF